MREAADLQVGRSVTSARLSRFGRELERLPVGNSLAIDLHQAGRFLTDMCAAIAIAAARILYRHITIRVFNHEAVAIAAAVAKPDEFAPSADADLAHAVIVAETDFPSAAIQRVEHGKRCLRQCRRCELRKRDQ